MKTAVLPSGERAPAFGPGSWNLGDDAAARAEEIATLRLGLDLGARLIDPAEHAGGRGLPPFGGCVARQSCRCRARVEAHNFERR